MLVQLVSPFLSDPAVTMSTLKAGRPPRTTPTRNVVKVVTDQRAATHSIFAGGAPLSARHRPRVQPFGLYGFRRDFLSLRGLPQTPLEVAESLEQLRALEHGFPIRTVVTEHHSIGVDTPEDLERARRLSAVEVRV